MNRYYSVRIIFHNTILGLPTGEGNHRPSRAVRKSDE